MTHPPDDGREGTGRNHFALRRRMVVGTRINKLCTVDKAGLYNGLDQ